ncbi:uncharacterized protein [Patagioenas fasciata]|uniref:uncharacterized protein n=1 Tax=Patagioenas fasciata TaxID=372321 RepID=UPI003A997FCD
MGWRSGAMLEEELRAKRQSEEARRDRSRAQLLKNEELLLEFENRIDRLLFHLHGITVPGQIFVKARDFLEKKMSSDPQNVVVSFEERDSSDDAINQESRSPQTAPRPRSSRAVPAGARSPQRPSPCRKFSLWITSGSPLARAKTHGLHTIQYEFKRSHLLEKQASLYMQLFPDHASTLQAFTGRLDIVRVHELSTGPSLTADRPVDLHPPPRLAAAGMLREGCSLAVVAVCSARSVTIKQSSGLCS